MTVSDREIAAVHVPTLASLAGVEAERVLREEGGTAWRGWWYELPDATVWGATGFMLHGLLTLVRREAPWALR
jgi:hypothetical protein